MYMIIGLKLYIWAIIDIYPQTQISTFVYKAGVLGFWGFGVLVVGRVINLILRNPIMPKQRISNTFFLRKIFTYLQTVMLCIK